MIVGCALTNINAAGNLTMDKWKSKQRTEAPPLSRLKSPLNEEGNIDPDDELAKVAPEFIMWVHKTHKVRKTRTHLVFDWILG